MHYSLDSGCITEPESVPAIVLQDMLLKRAADIAEALYSVPRPHSQLQALPSSPAHGSVMGLGSYPSQLGVSIGEPGQSSQGEENERQTKHCLSVRPYWKSHLTQHLVFIFFF